MYLSELEIFGFKSFALKTKLKFSEGLTAVVGPNGCGKSNIVDAVRWVLGEKKASTLRSDVMENVIFNGTKARKPLGMSEVSLILDNNKGVLPLEYSQVSITRRLFRSGDSEYLINNTKCRLKDILDLFMDTGMGSDSYSVIELKMVENILSGKLDERRSMFEEAAGIKKFKVRRKEAINRLATVKQDLERVTDIVAEIKKNVNSLSRQASKTRRYNTLQSELRESDTILLQQKFLIYKDDNDAIMAKIIEIEKQKINSEIKFQNMEKSFNLLNEQINSQEIELRDIALKEATLNSKISENNKELALNNQKIDSLKIENIRLIKEIENSESRKDKLKYNITRSREKVKEDMAELNRLAEKSISLSESMKEYESELNEYRSELDELNAQSTEFRSTISSKKNIINRNSGKINSLQSSIEKRQSEINESEQSILRLTNDIESKNLLIEKLKSELEELNNEFDEKSLIKEQLSKELEELKIEINRLKSELTHKKTEIEFLEGISVANESTNYLLNKSKKDKSKNLQLLGELIEIDEKYRNALTAVLGEDATTIIMDNDADAFEAIDLLKSNKKGKARIFARSILNKLPKKDYSEDENIIGLANDLITADSEIADIALVLLNGVAIAENRDKAIKAISTGNYKKIVTLEGEIFNITGIIKGGSQSGKEGIWLGRRRRIDKLEKEIIDITDKSNRLNSKFEELNNKYRQIDLNKLKQEIANTEKKAKNEESIVSSLQIKKDTIYGRIENIKEQISNANEEYSSLSQENKELNSELQIIESTFESIQIELNELKDKLDNSESHANDLRSEAKEIDIKKARLETEIKNLQNDIISMERRIINVEKDKEIDSNSQNNIEKEIEERGYRTNKIKLEVEELHGEIAEVKNLQDSKYQAREEVKAKAKEAAENLGKLRMEIESYQSKLHKADLEVSEVKSKMRIISGKLVENYSYDPFENEPEKVNDYDLTLAEREVKELKERLTNIGDINFLALEEYEKEKERYEFYEKQLADLHDSEKTLLETIEEVNQAAEKNFSETFVKINNNFKMLFKKLFSEDGEAELKLKSEDLLESDIEILAKPPNKRPHSIDMLSGGEKTLTAIALLFAIYLVKPSPFCILDEVDAPLDDANILKFVNMIRDFSSNTQFLIVTHNKKTMEACDTMYGITMQEDGVSKLVSVKLDRKEEV